MTEALQRRMDQPISTAPASWRGQLPILARVTAAIALLSLALPWIRAGGWLAGPRGLDLLSGTGMPTGTPSIPLFLSVGAAFLTLLIGMAMERMRAAGVGMIGYSIALILFAIFALHAIFSLKV